ncbi:MAG: T9SS type A sorting domain-containing protein [Candidatus Azobacteroides sp.]|nr:T9SS type A sorting domain-containing protein [Candidatus Azobacteroides sp.]
MKKYYFIFLLFLSGTICLFAHDYQTVYSPYPALFSIEGKIVTSEIDSVHMQGADSVFYPVKEMRENPEIGYCLLPSPSWLGEKIVIQDGLNVFLNLENEEIHIKTDAELNETWTVYRKEDDVRIEGKVIAHETEEFLGIEDLVKTISFQMYDKDNNLVEIYLPSVKISRSHGFIAAVNFICFPYVPENLNYLYFEGYNYLSTPELVGLTYPEAGIQNLTWREVYDFQPGDEIHTVSEDWLIYPNSGIQGRAYKEIYKYLGRTDHEDHIYYTVARTSLFHNLDDDKLIYTKDTIEIKQEAHPEVKLELLPQKIYRPEFADERSIFSYSASMELTDPISKIMPSEEMQVIQKWDEWRDNCWQYVGTDNLYTFDLRTIYLKGLGGPYFDHARREYITFFRELVYYKKGDKTWGTPLDIVNSIYDISVNNQPVIYPNPVKEILWIKEEVLDAASEITLTDLSGKIMVRKAVGISENVINLSNLPDGVYLYKLIVNNRNSYTGKIIKTEASGF